MDIFSLLTMLGGLALFLYGMNAMGDGLEKMAGGRLERILERLTSKKLLAVLLGAGVTAVIQSSSATTVMVVGFVNSGIMSLSQAVGVIMGANVGTTITSWMLSLTGISGDAVWVKLLKPSSFAPVLAAIGIVFCMTSDETEQRRDIGNILVGFAILMFGMETMSGAVAPLAENEHFTSILTAFSMPVLGMLAGMLLTAVIQSSSASVGILQALCLTGVVSYASAIPIIMGQNIGTCVTSIISSVGAKKNAKRASMVHLYFNLIGTIVFMAVFYLLNGIFCFEFMSEPASVVGIAVIHSLFNLACVVLFYPFSGFLVKLSELTIRDKGEEKTGSATEAGEKVVMLDERFLDTPAFAMEICRQATRKMAEEVKLAANMALDLLTEYNEENAQRVVYYEQRVDEYEDVIGSYLVKLSSRNLSKRDSQTMSVLLHSINDLERISDHAINLQESALTIRDKELNFSDMAREELAVMIGAVRDIVAKSVRVFVEENTDEAVYIEPMEEVIDRLTKKIKNRHVKRLRKGRCTIELGLVLEDVLTILERISDHCSNIAIAMVQIHDDEYDTHAYVERLNKEEGSLYYRECERLEKLYELPAEDKKYDVRKTDLKNTDTKKDEVKKNKNKKKDTSENEKTTNEKKKALKKKEDKKSDNNNSENKKSDVKKTDTKKSSKKSNDNKKRKE